MRRLGFLLATLLLVAGCGSGTSVRGGPGPSEAFSPPAGPTTTAPLVLVTATAIPWKDGAPPAPPHTTCGRASLTGDDYALVASGAASLRCFGKSVARCTAASLSYVKFGVDSGTDVVATVEPGASCRVRYVVARWTANGDGMTWPADTLHCGVQRTNDVVVLSCPGFKDRLPVA